MCSSDLDDDFVANQKRRLHRAFQILSMLMCDVEHPTVDDLSAVQKRWVARRFLEDYMDACSAGVGTAREYEVGVGRRCPDAEERGHSTLNPHASLRRTIRCVYSPSLADLSWNAFDCVVVDEGVRMKGAESIIGLGVRQMAPRYRLVLTATPIKDRKSTRLNSSH